MRRLRGMRRGSCIERKRTSQDGADIQDRHRPHRRGHRHRDAAQFVGRSPRRRTGERQAREAFRRLQLDRHERPGGGAHRPARLRGELQERRCEAPRERSERRSREGDARLARGRAFARLEDPRAQKLSRREGNVARLRPRQRRRSAR